jgi:hypothetical protein
MISGGGWTQQRAYVSLSWRDSTTGGVFDRLAVASDSVSGHGMALVTMVLGRRFATQELSAKRFLWSAACHSRHATYPNHVPKPYKTSQTFYDYTSPYLGTLG